MSTGAEKLRLATRLYPLLKFQRLVYARYGRKLSRKEADKLTILEAIEAIPDESEDWWEVTLTLTLALNLIGHTG